MNTVKLDTIDKKILLVLLKNSRISLTELARVIKQNYPVVRNRVIKLIENQVIRYFNPVVQYPGIGARRYMGIYLNLKNISAEKLKEIIKELKKNQFLIEVSELQGRWNISLLLVTNYIKEARDTLEYIQNITKDYLTDLIAMPTFHISNLNRQFFSELSIDVGDIKTGYAPLIKNTFLIHLGKPVKLSKEDIKLLDYLKLNGRATLEEIGKNINIDAGLVDYKLKRFISENLIRNFTIEINPAVLGYEQYLLFLNLRGNKEAKEKLVSELNNMKEAYHYYEYLNYWEIVVTFIVKNRDEFTKLFSSLQSKFSESIKDHEVLWLLEKHKKEPYPDVNKVYEIKAV